MKKIIIPLKNEPTIGSRFYFLNDFWTIKTIFVDEELKKFFYFSLVTDPNIKFFVFICNCFEYKDAENLIKHTSEASTSDETNYADEALQSNSQQPINKTLKVIAHQNGAETTLSSSTDEHLTIFHAIYQFESIEYHLFIEIPNDYDQSKYQKYVDQIVTTVSSKQCMQVLRDMHVPGLIFNRYLNATSQYSKFN